MQPGKKRAKHACVVCNKRRVKCDITEQHPCHNCSRADIPCEVRTSRRGKHPRAFRQAAVVSADSDDHPHGQRGFLSSPQPHLSHRVTPTSSSQSNQLDDVAASQVLATLSRDQQHNTDVAIHEDGDDGDDGVITGSPKVGAIATQHPPLEGQTESEIFLGESTTLRYVHDNTSDHDQQFVSSVNPGRLLHHLSAASKAASRMPDWEAECREARIKVLRREGAFSFPAPRIIEALLRSYFQWFHPCFSIIDEPTVWSRSRKNAISPLLLNAMLFISIIHLDEQAFRALGLKGDQVRAKFDFYSRAKDIYNADFEQDKTTVIQALFLLSFWRSGPLLEKDTRHWLATAISLGQSKALHRSTSSASGATRYNRIKRRLWWSIYTRERHCAAALGLPNRIRDKDCDVAALEPSDFDHAFAVNTSESDRQESILYQIGMANLSRILGQIVHCGYLPGKSLTQEQKLEIKEELSGWRKNLPRSAQLGSHLDNPPSLRVSSPHLAFNNLLILLYRNDYINNAEDPVEARTTALQAASHNVRIVEDLLPTAVLRHAQIHVITNLFNTLCIQVIHLRRSDGLAVPIAEHRAKVCLLGLQELQQTWDVHNWILQLFFQYLDRSTASRLLASQGDSGQDSRHQQQVTASNPLGGTDSDVTTTLDFTQPSLGTVWGGNNTGIIPDSPWSLTTEEQTNFLFTQIESDFAFGEGCVHHLWPDGQNVISNTLPLLEKAESPMVNELSVSYT